MQRQLSAPSLRFLVTVALCAPAMLAGCASTQTEISSDERPASAKQQDAGQMELPPGWTQADMQACMDAGTPGKMQAELLDRAGRWSGTCKMWMAPGTDPMQESCTLTISKAMDGRFAKWEMGGNMPGMGPYSGLGFMGYDNVAQKFVSCWVDNHSTGIMRGEGTRSSDGNTLTWTYHYMCPIQKKPTTLREVHRFTGDNAMTLEMHGKDPKTGTESQMMQIELKRVSS